MQLDVAFLPADVRNVRSSVCIVIDALRATSTLATLFGHGVSEVVVAGTIDEARRIHADLPDALLCGESGGLPPEGFDYGNSPVEFETLDLAGRRVILATSNGTRALAILAGARAVFTGSLLNLTACVGTARALAGTDRVTVVCSGIDLGTRFSLEDAVVAGAFIEQLVALTREASSENEPDLSDTAITALRLWRSYPAGARRAFEEASHGRILIGLGMSDDLDRCAELNRYHVAPRLTVTDTGLLVLMP